MMEQKGEETSLDFSCLAGIMNIHGFNFVLKWVNTYLEDKVFKECIKVRNTPNFSCVSVA
jgi:hypothetical protein